MRDFSDFSTIQILFCNFVAKMLKIQNFYPEICRL